MKVIYKDNVTFWNTSDGQKVRRLDTNAHCPKCGCEVNLGYPYCQMCGTRLTYDNSRMVGHETVWKSQEGGFIHPTKKDSTMHVVRVIKPYRAS